MTEETKKLKTGFALMDKEKHLEFAKKGGESTKNRKSSDYFRELGRKGGKARLEKYGREAFVAMGKISRGKKEE